MAHIGQTLAHRWFEEVWNQKRESAIDELSAEDAVVHGLIDHEGNPVTNRTQFKSLHRQFCAAFPDMRITVEDVLVDGDKLAARCSVTGTHSGSGLMLAATSKPISITGLCIIRIKDGKIAEAWNNFDFLALYQQLGMQLS